MSNPYGGNPSFYLLVGDDKVSDDNPVPVSATIEVGDLQIGAIELKDSTTDVRQNVELDVSKNAAYVKSESLASESTLSSINTLLTDGTQKTRILDKDGENISVQNPVPCDGDSVYCKDIDVDNSDIGDFTGGVCDLFNSLKTVITNDTADNPKTLKVWFYRTVYSHQIGLGCDDLTEGFGTDVTVKLLGSGEEVRFTKNFSGINPNSALLEFEPKAFNGFILEFNTASKVCISNITIRKAVETDSTIQGLNPDNLVKNVELAYFNSLKTALYDGETGRRAEVEPLGALKTETPVRLVGTTFSNGTKDPNFWTETTTGSGTVSQNGEIVLSTGTTADSTALYQTVAKAGKITGTTNQFRLVGKQVEAAAADCIRRAGAYDSDNGFFFQYDGDTFEVGSRKAGVDTIVSNGSFNGNGGATISADETEFTKLTIDYTALNAHFFVNGTLIHTLTAVDSSLTNTLDLPATMEVINENGNTEDNSFKVLFATILRLGSLTTSPASDYQSGTTAGKILKYSSGIVNELAISGVANNSVVTLYDNTAATGTIIYSTGSMSAQTQPFTIPFTSGLPFSNGLTLVISGATSTVTTLYE